MAGIVSYGAYIPRYRLKRETIYSAMGWLNRVQLKGEKAVANWDEDSVTMAVGASIDCLRGLERKKIDGLYFATTTAPYRGREDASIITGALNLRSDVRSADFTDSTTAGTTALLAAYDSVAAGSVNNMLVCSADCRPAKAGGADEHIYGDAGAAFLLGNDDVLATFEGSYTVSRDFMGHWRLEYDRYEHGAEDRFSRDIGYLEFLTESISGLLKKCNVDIKNVSKIVCPGTYAREHAAIGKKLGADPSQLQDAFLTSVGDAGSAQSLLMLVAALEEAKSDDLIVVASNGSGSDAILLRVTDGIGKQKEKSKFDTCLASKKELDSYEKYLAFRDMITVDKGTRGEEMFFSQVTLLYRERKAILGLVGVRCTACGTPQYPRQRICVKPGCGAIDHMEDYHFSDKQGELFTYTGDNLQFSINPPAIYGMLNFDGGGRYWFDFSDCDLDSLEIGMKMEMSFRRRFQDEKRGINGYFWSAVPTRS